MPAGFYRIAGLLRRLIWRQNEIAAHNQRRRDTQPTEEMTFLEDESWEHRSGGLPDSSTQKKKILESSERLGDSLPVLQGIFSLGDPSRTIGLQTQNNEDEPLPPNGNAPVARMTFKSPGLTADRPRFSGTAYRGSSNLARVAGPSVVSSGTDDDETYEDEDDGEEDDEEDEPTPPAGRKRSRPHRSDAFHGMSSSTKGRHLPEIERSGRETRQQKRYRRMNRAAVTSGAAAKDYNDNQSESSYAQSLRSRGPSCDGHGPLLSFSTSDLGPSRNSDDRRADLPRGTDPDRFGRHSSPSRQRRPSPAAQGRNDQPGPAVNRQVEILVISFRGSLATFKEYPGGSLKGKELHVIFDEVSKLMSRQEIQRIKFKLETSRKANDRKCIVERGDTNVFPLWRKAVKRQIKKCAHAGETRFKILLELDPDQQGAEEAEDANHDESDEDYW